MGFTIGDVAVDIVPDLDPFVVPAARLLPDADLAALAADRGWLEPDHLDGARGDLLLRIHAVLLRLPGLTVLVDACVGEDKSRAARPDWHGRRATGFLDRLAALGVAPEGVDRVLCTHLHADHVGWNTRLLDGRWVPTFPNARYLIGRDELATWQARAAAEPGVNHGSFADSVQPLLDAGLVDTVAADHEIAPGVTLTPLPGHTAGHLGIRIERAGARAVLCGDAIHSPVQVLRPEWSSAFCSDPEAARATRRRLLECVAEDDTLLIPAHFRGPGCARIHRTSTGFRPVFGAG